MGFNYLKTREPLRGGSLLLKNKPLGQPQKNICFPSVAGWIFFQSEPVGAPLFSCLSSYSSTLNVISTPLNFVLPFIFFIWIRLIKLIFSPWCKYATLIMYNKYPRSSYQVTYQAFRFHLASCILQMITCTYQKLQSRGVLQILKINQSIIHYVRKIIRKTNISYPLIRTFSCAYRGVNVSFSQNFASIINEWSLVN